VVDRSNTHQLTVVEHHYNNLAADHCNAHSVDVRAVHRSSRSLLVAEDRSLRVVKHLVRIHSTEA